VDFHHLLLAGFSGAPTIWMPCSTSTAASGRSRRRCNRPPLAPMPPSRIATGTMASGCWRARKATRMPLR
jgi:hypothetical protein